MISLTILTNIFDVRVYALRESITKLSLCFIRNSFIHNVFSTDVAFSTALLMEFIFDIHPRATINILFCYIWLF